MTNWIYKDDKLKKILDDNCDEENEATSVQNIITNIVHHIQQTKCYINLDQSVIDDIKQAKTFHQFNRVLDKIYDYADENKIWLGI